MRRQRSNHLYQNLGIIALSILVAILISQSTALEAFVASIGEKRLIGSFLAGVLFTSVFSTAPAAVLLGELAQANSAWLVAFTGALGAVVGDYVIFRFVRDRLSEDMLFLLNQRKRRLKKILKLPTARCAQRRQLKKSHSLVSFRNTGYIVSAKRGLRCVGIFTVRPECVHRCALNLVHIFRHSNARLTHVSISRP